MKKYLKIVILVIIVLIVLVGLFVFQKNREAGNLNISKSEGITIALSLEDEITDNSAWCGTFNLIWNDLKNDLAKQEIVFTPQLEIVENLNKSTFTTSYLSEDSYYKIYGHPSIELKEQIEKAIKEKFNETSDILDGFDWNNSSPDAYFLYVMLKKEFEFPKKFTELDNGTFGNYENVEYFGIDEDTNKEVKNQVQVLYYDSDDDFAIKLLTKSNDEVIISRGTTKNTFGDIYQEITDKSENYNGNANLGENDNVKIPKISFNLKEEFKELEGKPFLFSNGDEYVIETALQTIQFELDETGGRIKSEAGMMVQESAMVPADQRNFIVDDTFVIFLKEEDKDLPYFGAKISDISSVQSNAKEIEK